MEEILRKTTTVCPVCLKELPGFLLKNPEGVFLQRTCPKDGEFKIRLSSHPDYYAELDNYFFKVMPPLHLPQRDYLLRLTPDCNLKCPICLAGSGEFPESELKLSDFSAFLASKKGRLKIDLMSAEPTLREDLSRFIKISRQKGQIAALHTNGIKLADFNYLQELKKAGLSEVHLQFDGFSETVNLALRGEKLLAVKLKALANLEKLKMATDLVMVISPGLNQDQIKPMLDFCGSKPFIRELFFLGLRSLGRARQKEHSQCLLPDQVIDLVEAACPELIHREAVKSFQKLYFTLLSFFGVRKCLYIQHYLLFRKKGRLLPICELFNLNELEKALELYPKLLKAGKLKKGLWGLKTFLSALEFKNLPYLLDLLCLNLGLKTGFSLAGLPSDTLLLGFITACDPFIFDQQVADFCGKGELSTDLGLQESGAVANIKRERLWFNEREKMGTVG